MSILEELHRRTFVLEHNPNCKNPFLIRLSGYGQGRIDSKPIEETRDVVGCGETLEEAAKSAISQRKWLEE